MGAEFRRPCLTGDPRREIIYKMVHVPKAAFEKLGFSLRASWFWGLALTVLRVEAEAEAEAPLVPWGLEGAEGAIAVRIRSFVSLRK